MNKRMRELLQEINNKKAEARSFLDADKITEAKAVKETIENLQAKFDIEAMLDDDAKSKVNTNDAENKIDSMKVFCKALRGQPLTEAENALITGGLNGENNIIPQDINTQINEYRRQYKSARALVGFYPATTLSGSFVYEDLTGTGGELANLTDGADIGGTDPKIAPPVPYAIKEYGGLLPVSNVLLQNEKGGLVPYIGRWFVKKSIKTENSKIFAQLQKKAAKDLTDWKALKSSLNKDIDPVFTPTTVIVTNQDGFDILDSALDGTGRPILQPNPSNPTQKQFMGYDVEVFSNALLPTTGTTTKKAPIIYGSLVDAITFVGRDELEFATSTEFLFGKNQTALRVIQLFDVIGADAGAYVNGQITVV